MRLYETVLLYLLIGLAVGASLAWRDRRRAGLWLTVGVIFWPIFVVPRSGPLMNDVPSSAGRAASAPSISDRKRAAGRGSRMTV